MTISCEISSQTIASDYCEHGRLVITCEWCVICKMEHRINLLESQIKKLTERFNNINEYKTEIIQSLINHKNYQIDENRKVSKTLDELRVSKAGSDWVARWSNEINKKINDLESESVSVSVLHSSNQAHDTWKTGCEALISGIMKDIGKLQEHYYSDGDISAIHGQLANIEKNNKFDEHQRKILEDRITELEKSKGSLRRDDYVMNKKPHKCPVCMVWLYLQDPINLSKWICKACQNTGIIWG